MRGDVVKQLQERYQEVPIIHWLSPDGKFMTEVFASHEGGTVSVVKTDTTGKSCLVDAGDSMQRLITAYDFGVAI